MLKGTKKMILLNILIVVLSITTITYAWYLNGSETEGNSFYFEQDLLISNSIEITNYIGYTDEYDEVTFKELGELSSLDTLEKVFNEKFIYPGSRAMFKTILSNPFTDSTSTGSIVLVNIDISSVLIDYIHFYVNTPSQYDYTVSEEVNSYDEGNDTYRIDTITLANSIILQEATDEDTPYEVEIIWSIVCSQDATNDIVGGSLDIAAMRYY